MPSENARGKKHGWTLPQTQAVQAWLIDQVRWRDLALIMLGIDSLYRSIDLRHQRFDDVVDVHGNIRSRIIHGQQKTGRTVESVLSVPTRQALAHWITLSGKQSGHYLFTHLTERSDIPPNTPITRNALADIIKQCSSAIGLDPARYSTKTLRRTRTQAILEKADGDFRVPRDLLGHADIRSTIHYFDFDRERALQISEDVKFFTPLPETMAAKLPAKASR
ncbi:MAG: tyrosine-type recombinase/integrase [Pseudomonadota bacterium]